ncbi:MAG: hypothetical protein Q4A76_11100 [Porphyromonadaceae bacterium]|nr:hypothetical protein [Porphyromonadaceae bacterium]
MPYPPDGTYKRKGRLSMGAAMRLRWIRLLDKIRRYPECAERLGLEIPQWAKNQNQEDDRYV